MTMKVGRVSLRTAERVRPMRRNAMDEGRNAAGSSNPAKTGTGPRGYAIRGSEQGTTSQSLVDALDKEAARPGSVYVTDDNTVTPIPAGYYVMADFNPEYPGGAPRVRPYDFTLWESPMPFVCRQAESDNVAGADVADYTADEGYHVAYTPTTAEVVVLQPGQVAGAEALNLPAGSYKVIARVYQVTNSSAKLRWGLRDGADVQIIEGAQVAVGAADQWVDVDLGTLTVTQTYDRSNWYHVKVQGVAGELGDVRIDRLLLYPV